MERPSPFRPIDNPTPDPALKKVNNFYSGRRYAGWALVLALLFIGIFLWPGPQLKHWWTNRKAPHKVMATHSECQAVVDSVCILDTTYWRPRNGYMVPVFGPQDSIIPTLFKSLRKDSVIKLKFYRRPQ